MNTKSELEEYPKKTITSIFSDQTYFVQAGDQTTDHMNLPQKHLYEELIHEEMTEFVEAVEDESLVHQIKEANDIIVVVAGWLLSVGIDPEEAWKAVHQNNMLKVANPPTKDASGKIQKSPEAIAGKQNMMKRLKYLAHD